MQVNTLISIKVIIEKSKGGIFDIGIVGRLIQE